MTMMMTMTMMISIQFSLCSVIAIVRSSLEKALAARDETVNKSRAVKWTRSAADSGA